VDWLNDNSGAIQAVATVLLVLVTMAYATLVRWQARLSERQVKETARGSQAQATIDVMLFLQAEYVRDARRTVRAMPPNDAWEEAWTPGQIEAVGIVCSSFDAVAMLVLNDLLDEDPFVGTWAITLVKCYEVCEPYIRRLREDQSGPTFWKNFEWAAGRAAEKLARAHATEASRQAP
jgi:hypothetical protein